MALMVLGLVPSSMFTIHPSKHGSPDISLFPFGLPCPFAGVARNFSVSRVQDFLEF